MLHSNHAKALKQGPRRKVLAAAIVQEATGEAQPEELSKNPAAVALGRLGGKEGREG